MTRRLARLLTFFLLTLPYTICLSAEPSQDFEQGNNAYLYGDYPAVLAKIEPLVEPQIRLTDPDQLARAYELLGLSYFYLNRQEDAQRVFEKLVRFRPDQQLNPVLVPPPAVAFYNAIRARLADEIAREREALRKRQLEDEALRRKANQVLVEVEVRHNSKLVALLPFGSGQFQNEQPALGSIFLGTELVAIGVSTGLFLSVQSLRLDSGAFAREDVTRARDMRTGMWVSGGIAVGLIIAGTVNALLNFEERVETNRRVSPAPSDTSNSPLSFTF